MTTYARVSTELPGPRSRELFHDAALAKFIAGKPDNETHWPVVFERASGCVLVDVDGNEYLDFSNALNLPFGHELWDFLPASPVVNSSNYLTPQRLRLVRELSALFPDLDGFQFRSSGTEAVEAALRYGRACHPRDLNVIGLEGAYHGLTLAAQQVMGKTEWGAERVELWPFPTTESAPELLTRLRSALAAAPVLFAFETIQGGTLRALPAEFLHGLASLREAHPMRLLLFCDDMLASIRCGGWSSLPPGMPVDMLVGGKSWSGGFPFSWFGVSSPVRECAGDILGTTTYGANPIACAAAAATIQRMRREHVLEDVVACHERIRSRWLPRLRVCSQVLRAECRGLLFGVELTSEHEAQRTGAELMRRGLVTARIGALLRCSPPLTIPTEALDEGLGILVDTLERRTAI